MPDFARLNSFRLRRRRRHDVFSLARGYLRAGAETAAATPAFFKGWSPGYNAGTVADYYVGNVTGNDANPGTLSQPFRTFAAAILAAIAAGGQKHIKVFDQGTHYRDSIITAGWNGPSAGAKCSITGYGTQKPVIRGDDPFTGWTQCSAADATLLGGTLGVNGSPVYKKTIARSSIVGDNLYSMAVTENDALVPMVQDAASIPNPHIIGNASTYYTATVTNNGAPNFYVDTLTNAAFGAYTSAQLANATLVWHAFPNVAKFAAINSVAGNVASITPAFKAATYTNDANPGATTGFLILNILPKLTAGTFGYVDVGGGNVDVYIYPTNAANLAAGNVGIVTRKRLIDAGASDYLKIEGFDLMNMGGGGGDDATKDGCPLAIGYDTSFIYQGKQKGIECRHIRVRNQAAGNAIFSQIHTDIRLEYITVSEIFSRTKNLRRCCGLQYLTVASEGARVLFFDIRNVEESPMQFYGQKNAVFAFSYIQDSGLGSHTNIMNSYLGSDNVLYYGIETVNAAGFATWQASSGITMAMCLFDHVYAISGDAIRDQMTSGDPPTIPAEYWVFNNSTRGSISVGAGNNTDNIVDPMTIYAYNNLCAILQYNNPLTQAVVVHSHNALLDSGTAFGAVGAFDNQFSSASVFAGSTMDLHASSPLIGLGGKNLEARLLALEAQYGLNLHYDARGYAFPTLDFTGALCAARGVADVTAPTLSSPTASALSSASISIGVTTAEAKGGVWWVLTTSATPPTAAQIAAGQNHLGVAAVKNGVFTNVSAGAKSTSPTGLSASTQYYAYFTHEDMHGNRSAVATANATTLSALTGIQLIDQSGRYTNFASSHNLTIPAMLEGDCMVILAQIVTGGANVTQNPVQSGYTYDGAAWDGTKLPPSTTPASSKPATYVWHRVAGAGGVAGHTFTIPLSGANNITLTYFHFRGDFATTGVPLSFVGYNATVSSTYPSLSLNNGDAAVTFYNNIGTNSGSNQPVLAANATAFGVSGAPALPQSSGVWINAYSASSVPKNMALLKPVTSTGTYTSPTTADTSTFSAFLLGLRQ